MACPAEPLGDQPLKLTSHKQIDNEAAHRKIEESSERHSGALLGGYREVSVSTHCSCCDILDAALRPRRTAVYGNFRQKQIGVLCFFRTICSATYHASLCAVCHMIWRKLTCQPVRVQESS